MPKLPRACVGADLYKLVLCTSNILDLNVAFVHGEKCYMFVCMKQSNTTRLDVSCMLNLCSCIYQKVYHQNVLIYIDL